MTISVKGTAGYCNRHKRNYEINKRNKSLCSLSYAIKLIECMISFILITTTYCQYHGRFPDCIGILINQQAVKRRRCLRINSSFVSNSWIQTINIIPNFTIVCKHIIIERCYFLKQTVDWLRIYLSQLLNTTNHTLEKRLIKRFDGRHVHAEKMKVKKSI